MGNHRVLSVDSREIDDGDGKTAVERRTYFLAYEEEPLAGERTWRFACHNSPCRRRPLATCAAEIVVAAVPVEIGTEAVVAAAAAAADA